MDFNPISMGDEGAVLDRRNDSRGERALDAHGRLGGPSSGGASHSEFAVSATGAAGLLSPSTSLAAAHRQCMQHYFHDFSWSVPFPETPASPLLYCPAECRELLSDPAAVGVMQAELDAMATGVLEKIPLAYYPLKPGVIAHVRDTALATERHVADMRERSQASGHLDRLVWRPEDVNPLLSKADADLLDTDIDGDLVLRRDLPSLTLLQRPLYTDMGLVPQEERHSARLARIVPQTLRALSQGAGLPGSPLSPASPALGGATAASVFETKAQADAKQKAWVEEVSRSFRYARTLDGAFDRFITGLVHAKLGLNPHNEAHVLLGRTLWSLLLDGTLRSQQRGAWHALCRFSHNYDAAEHTRRQSELEDALRALKLPAYAAAWRPRVAEYVEAVSQYVQSLAGGVGERRAQLNFSDLELDPQYAGGFVPELRVEPALARQGAELSDTHTRLPVFPVEVIPVFPSSFDKAGAAGVTAAKSASGELDYLAEASEHLHHAVLPGAVVNAARRAGPHVVVGGTNLLVADPPSTVADVRGGATVSFHTSHENTFEPLFRNGDNTSSYVLRVHTSRPGAALRGATSRDGRYITYDRIGSYDFFVKAANVRPPPFSRHVVLFETDAEAQQDAQRREDAGAGAKRAAPREGEGDGTEGAGRAPADAKRLRVE